MLPEELKQQLTQYFAYFEQPIVFGLDAGDDENSKEVRQFVEEIAALTDKITIEERQLELTPSFSIEQAGTNDPRIVFAGVPLGHEFESLVLAMIQVSGRPPKVDPELKARIEAIDTKQHFETYVTLSCNNCPAVVQALNLMSVINPNISHTMIEGSRFQDRVDKLGVMAVPAIFKDGSDDLFHSGRASLEELVSLIGGAQAAPKLDSERVYDLLVVGGGPAGGAAAIYGARKGIDVGLIANEFGGQVLDTLGIENFISVPYIEGPDLMANVRRHVEEYKVDILEGYTIQDLKETDQGVELTTHDDQVVKALTVVIATGARWRLLGIPGETEFLNKGIAYCPHCDGPLFADKPIAVIGGGNSGVEAALDLAGLAKKVTVIEFLDELQADDVLQTRLRELPNVEIITNAATSAITGEGKVQQLHYTDRETEEEHTIDVDGVFPLIGLVPNTEWAKDTVGMTDRGELIVDGHGRTDVKGVYAAGDCTDVAYKQIIISMGSGATAALGAYDYLLRSGLLNH